MNNELENTYRECRARAEWAGALIRDERVRVGWSLREMAAAVGTDAPTLSRIEKGEMLASVPVLKRLRSVLQHPSHAQTAPSGVPTPYVRVSDPVSSQDGLVKMVADVNTKQLVGDAIVKVGTLLDEFTDSDLTAWLRPYDKPRNIVARYRGWAEEAGQVERVGVKPDRHGNRLMHFRIVP